ncbi:hypothetical protein A5731_21825 [Mycolicibacterium conceptionense]|nr:hypothetical protein A5718_10845 [Mycolicibacterium conceptionense]OBE98356.1 hypothetical protein A5731_21825 [Mycolicibacterium conceptionense]
MRGVGKTQIAAAYVRSWIDQKRGLVAWVNAENSDVAVSDLARLAEVLGIAEPAGDSAALARRAIEQLATREGESLLVFDNAANPDDLRRFIPTVGRCRIVITSVDTAFGQLGTLLDVAEFTPEESIAYLLGRTDIDDPIGAGALAAELGDLPLALAAAAATIRQRRYHSFAHYQTDLRDYPVQQMLQRPPGHEYDQSTAAALLMSVDALSGEDVSGASARLIGIMAVLSPDGVSSSIFETGRIRPTREASPLDDEPRRTAFAKILKRFRRQDPLGRLLSIGGEAIDDGVRYSLLAWSMTDESLSMHRLTARVVRERASVAGKFHEMTMDALDLLESCRFDESEAWNRRDLAADLVTQIEALWDNSEHHQSDRNIRVRLLKLRGWSVNVMHSLADFSRAAELGGRVLADHERFLGEDDPETMHSRATMADMCIHVGRNDEGIALYKQLLADYERGFGMKNIQSLYIRSELANGYLRAGMPEHATEVLEQILTEYGPGLGADHGLVLRIRSLLGDAYRQVGRLREAIDLQERTLAVMVEEGEADVIAVESAKGLLARCYGAVGKPAEAITLLEAVVASREKRLGSDNPQTLEARTSLARAYLAAFRHSDAINCHEQTLAERERTLGADHPDTLYELAALADAYRSRGRLHDAIDLYERAITEGNRVFGDYDLNVLGWHGDLAASYLSVGRTNEAIAVLQGALTRLRSTLGEEHKYTLITRERLAIAYGCAGRHGEAIELLQHNLADCERVMGPEARTTCQVRSTLAAAFTELGSFDEALHLQRVNLSILERTLEADHPDICGARLSLGATLARAERMSDAIQIFEQLLADQELLGVGKLDTLGVRQHLAYAYSGVGRMSDAITVCQGVLDDAVQVYGRDHPYAVDVRNTLSAMKTRAAEVLLPNGQTMHDDPEDVD